MNQTKSRPILSGFFNYFILGTIANTLIVFLLISGGYNIQLLGTIIFGSFITFLIVYHSFFANRLQLVTPGERMAGCVLNEGMKIWVNRYRNNRFFLFMTIFMLLYYPANIYDDVYSGEVMNISSIYSKCIWAFMFLFFVYKIADGKFIWSIGCYIFFVPSILGLLEKKAEPVVIWIAIGMIALTCLFLIICTIFYSSKSNNY